MAVEQIIPDTIKMTPEHKKVLENLDSSIQKAEHALEGLEAAGMDVTAMRNELNVSKARRDVLLKYFG